MTETTQLALPNYIRNGMIIQQQKPIVLSGRDKASIPVTVELIDEKVSTETDAHGQWSVILSARPAGGPYTIHIAGSTEVTIEDVLIGEVWLIGGQSNMELPINRTYDEFKEEIDSAHYPDIRQFHLELDPVFNEPKSFLKQGEWKEAAQENIQNFSSLGFFYAKKLHEELNVPVGIIHTAVGGTPIEAWMSEETLLSLGNYTDEIAYWKDSKTVEKEIEKDSLRSQIWYSDLNGNDKGLKDDPKWYEEQVDTSDWKGLTIPVMFKDTELAEFCGAVWFRKTFEITEDDLESQTYRLRLGSLINGDETFLNGKKVGETGYRYPPRKYVIEKDDLKVGENTLVIRLSIDAANGGFIPTFPYQLEMDTHSLSLEGEWLYKVGYQKDIIDPMLFLHYKPAALYKGMLHPLKEINVKGFLFYQGESNTGRPEGYSDLMKLMVEDWRSLFKDPLLPFYFVQLANYIDPAVETDDHGWAVLRNEQDQARFTIDYSEMVPAYDCGISYELHPHDKKTLAHRLAAVALNRDYKSGEAFENLEVKSIEVAKDNVTLTVKGLKGDLRSSENMPEFEVLSGDEWVLINDLTFNRSTISLVLPVHIGSDSLTAVRYAWRNDPKGYVYDDATHLPLLPFIKDI